MPTIIYKEPQSSKIRKDSYYKIPTYEFTILMPCLNESETLGICIDKAKTFLQNNNISGEVVVADNGSTDGSQEIAINKGSRVVNVKQKGYGNALKEGIKESKGKYIIMGDADDSYDFGDLSKFVKMLREGYDLVMGNRFLGKIMPGAMPWLHKYIGNPVLSFIGRTFFKSSMGDFHCGLRGFNKESIKKLNLKTGGMEFASEMVVKASLKNFKVAEVPINLYPDGRSRAPHLRSWRDGWRHLRFMLIFSPRWLFLYPGILMIAIGLFGVGLLFFSPLKLGHTVLDIHSMLYAAMFIIIGFQIVSFSIFSRIFAMNIGLIENDNFILKFLKTAKLENGLITGVIFTLIGIFGAIYTLTYWSSESFGPLVPTIVMRYAILSLTFLVIGMQIIFSSFFVSILNLNKL